MGKKSWVKDIFVFFYKNMGHFCKIGLYADIFNQMS